MRCSRAVRGGQEDKGGREEGEGECRNWVGEERHRTEKGRGETTIKGKQRRLRSSTENNEGR